MPLAADDPRKKTANLKVAAKKREVAAKKREERAKKLAAPDASANREGADPEGAGNLHMTGHEGGDDPCPDLSEDPCPDLADRLWAQKKVGVVWTAPTWIGSSPDESLTQPVDAPDATPGAAGPPLELWAQLRSVQEEISASEIRGLQPTPQTSPAKGQPVSIMQLVSATESTGPPPRQPESASAKVDGRSWREKLAEVGVEQTSMAQVGRVGANAEWRKLSDAFDSSVEASVRWYCSYCGASWTRNHHFKAMRHAKELCQNTPQIRPCTTKYGPSPRGIAGVRTNSAVAAELSNPVAKQHKKRLSVGVAVQYKGVQKVHEGWSAAIKEPSCRLGVWPSQEQAAVVDLGCRPGLRHQEREACLHRGGGAILLRCGVDPHHVQFVWCSWHDRGLPDYWWSTINTLSVAPLSRSWVCVAKCRAESTEDVPHSFQDRSCRRL